MKKIVTLSLILSILLMAGSPIHDLMDNRIKGKSYTGTLDDNIAAQDGLGIIPLQHHSGTSLVNSELAVQKQLKVFLDKSSDTERKKDILHNLSSAELTALNNLSVQELNVDMNDFFGDGSSIYYSKLDGNTVDNLSNFSFTGGYAKVIKGISDGALEFDGNLANRMTASNPQLTTTGTFSFWINSEAIGNETPSRSILSNNGGWGARGFSAGLKHGDTHDLRFHWQTGGDVYLDTTNNDVAPDGTWKHVVMTADLNSLKIYVNGTLRASRSISTQDVNNGGPLMIGGCTHGGFPGGIDNVRIFKRAVTDAEVTALYNERLNILNTSSMSSCKAIKTAVPALTLTGYYPTAGGIEYCDMTTDGGGWTRTFRMNHSGQSDGPTRTQMYPSVSKFGTLGASAMMIDLQNRWFVMDGLDQSEFGWMWDSGHGHEYRNVASEVRTSVGVTYPGNTVVWSHWSTEIYELNKNAGLWDQNVIFDLGYDSNHGAAFWDNANGTYKRLGGYQSPAAGVMSVFVR